MAAVLIDNSTVSSIQRALGKAQLRNPGVLDIEHSALERFAEAVLFADRVVVPDNYKEQFTPARKKLLAQFNVQFIPIAQAVDTALSEMTGQLTSIWTEAFAEGQDRALFDLYFEQIQAFSSFIWEHASSEFFLVFRAHGVGKESPLIEALLASPKDDDLGKRLRILAEDGRQVEWNKLSRHVQRMLGVMGWLGHQYIWHQVLAARHGLTYSPHPLREFFANDFLDRLGQSADSAVRFQNAFRTGTAYFQGKLSEALKRLGGMPGTYEMNLPALLPVLLRESNSSDEFITVLAQMRTDKRVTEIREILSQIDTESDNGNFRKRSQFINDMENIGNLLLLERGLDQRLIRIKPPTSVIGISIEGDDTGVALPIPSALYQQFFFNRKYRAFLRDVMRELAAPSQYGQLKTKLNSWAWLDDKSDYAGDPFYLKPYRFPSKFHRPLESHQED